MSKFGSAKFGSDIFNLPSKLWLKYNRKIKWRGLLLQNDLDLELSSWWSGDEKLLEQDLWVEADLDYDGRKVLLKEQLKALSKDDLKVYFSEIGIAEQDVDTWL